MFPRIRAQAPGSVHAVGVLRRFWGGGLPASARAALPLAAGERVLAYAAADGGYLVATDRALYLPSGYRIGWEHVEHAGWQRGGVYVREIVALGEEPAEHYVGVTEPGALPDIVRDRVTSSIVINQHVRLTQQGGVRMVGRRRPGSGEVVWNLVFDPELDARDPEVRARAERVLVEVRRQTGL